MSTGLQIDSLDDLVYGSSPRSIRCGHGVQIGSGEVLPEINFTLPPMSISDSTWSAVREQYRDMVRGVLERAAALHVPQLAVEFETLPEMTHRPAWGLDICRLLADEMEQAYTRHGLATALRFTPNDTRDASRPPRMRTGPHWDAMCESISGAGAAGADMISIESTGGKEIHDKALLQADLAGIVFALGVLGARDMAFVWSHIVDQCARQDVIPAGDTACGFANTAMILADRGMIPRVLAAVVRVASVPRSSVACSEGAVGPSKDCAYEGPYLKAIHGIPISMEGRSAACAHLSPVGNVAQSVCDLWSNESVQNVPLLSGTAPVVSMEQLAYDCRLMNTARATPGGAHLLRDWLACSDAAQDVQAYVLHPETVLRLARLIASEDTPYAQTVIAVRAAIAEIADAYARHRVQIPSREIAWLDRLRADADRLPETECRMIEQMATHRTYESVFLPSEYGIENVSFRGRKAKGP